MKKLVSFLLALVLVLSSVSALAAYNDHTDYVDWPIVKDGEKLTVSVATKRSEQYGKDPDQQWFWIWSETYSGIDFEVDQILSTAVDERKSLMFASGDLPDLLFGINLDTSELVRYGMGEGMLLDLTDLNLDYTPYPEGITALYHYEDKQWAVPKDYDTIALAYNKELFDKAGIAYPDDTWTWDTLRENAKKLTDADNGIYGFGAPNDTQSGYYNFVYQNGGFIFEDGKSGFDQEATQEAIQTWADLMLKDGVSPSLESFTDMGNDDQFQAGKVAMVFVGSWMMSAYTSNEFIKDKFDVAVLPQGKQRASIYNGLGYAGAYNTANPEIVKDFIAFCGSEQANIRTRPPSPPTRAPSITSPICSPT